MGWLGRASEADRQAVHKALKQAQLEDYAQRPIAKLSGGEQQRVLLATALSQSTPTITTRHDLVKLQTSRERLQNTVS